jgi:hypothetical protein
MANDDKAKRERAERLGRQIDRLTGHGRPESVTALNGSDRPDSGADADAGPEDIQPGESPQEYVERRSRLIPRKPKEP